MKEVIKRQLGVWFLVVGILLICMSLVYKNKITAFETFRSASNRNYQFVKKEEVKVPIKQLVKVETVNRENQKPKLTTLEKVLAQKDKKVTFTGTITAYGPDCKGCGGHVGCKPNQDVRNGNIYYSDNTYGKLRIVASDKKIPCGTVVKVTPKNYESFNAIVLDRGGAIKGTLFDLLFESELKTGNFGRRAASYSIERWGW